jgi:hypothetical protein
VPLKGTIMKAIHGVSIALAVIPFAVFALSDLADAGWSSGWMIGDEPWKPLVPVLVMSFAFNTRWIMDAHEGLNGVFPATGFAIILLMVQLLCLILFQATMVWILGLDLTI